MEKTNIERVKKLDVYLCLRNRRKRQFMQTILTNILSIVCSKKHPRSIWVKPRSQSFSHEIMTNHWNEEDSMKNMRMSHDDCNLTLTVHTLRPYISKGDIRFLKCIPAEIKLAATLYYLSGASDCQDDC